MAPELRRVEVRRALEIEGDHLGVHEFPSATGAPDLTILWFSGTASSGLVDVEPMLAYLRKLGRVIVFDRQTSAARSFDELAGLHAAAIQRLRKEGRVGSRVLFVAHSYGAQVAMRAAAQLGANQWFDSFGSVLLEPCLGPRDARGGEVPESDVDLIGWGEVCLVPWATVRAFIWESDVRKALKLQNPGDEIPAELVRATLASLQLEHGLEQAAALTAEELGWAAGQNPDKASAPLKYPEALAKQTFAILGARDPYYTVKTQGRLAAELKIALPERAPSIGHHGHYLHTEEIVRLLEPKLREWGLTE